MALAITSTPAGELLTLEEAKRHLRVYGGDLDDEISSLVRAARDDCERDCNRTLRAAVTRTWKRCGWWVGELSLPFPPLLTVSSVSYFDASNIAQTLASSNYHVLLSTDSVGRLAWASGATAPSVYDRPDAVTITFTTGYADLDSVPPVAVQAIKVKLSELWGTGTDSEVKAAVECTRRLLGKVDATGYA